MPEIDDQTSDQKTDQTEMFFKVSECFISYNDYNETIISFQLALLFLGCSCGFGLLTNEEQEQVMVKSQDIPGQNKLSGFANETRSKFHRILLNMSRYIPVSIEYAEEVGRNCNIIEYNGDYYGPPALVFAAILFIVGGLFCFVGNNYYNNDFCNKDSMVTETVMINHYCVDFLSIQYNMA